jgi:hypothetical protein
MNAQQEFTANSNMALPADRHAEACISVMTFDIF